MRVRWSWLLLACAVAGCGDKRSRPAAPDDAATAPIAPDDAAGARFRLHDTLASALGQVLALEPRVLGVGELHQTHQTAAVKSTLRRFTDDALDLLAPHTGDLLVETWVREGRCGATEARVNRDVSVDTERPEATETELGALARRARELDIEPHALTMTCDDYEAVADPDGGVDYERFLELIAARLRTRALELDGRADGDGHRAVVVYGGAIHNDRYPDEVMADWSYGDELAATLGDAFVELDLLVPEMIDARDSESEDWYPIYRQHAANDRFLLIERRPRSFVLILPRGVAAP